jgi:hypothetical protein
VTAPLPNDLVGFHRGLNRETAASYERFAGHRARVTALALEAGGETLALLGAGNCNDVDLPALAARFRQIHLIDLDREAMERARRRQPAEVASRIVIHGPVDLGGARLLGELRGRPVGPALLGGLPGRSAAEALAALPVRAEVVMSAGLLSQIVHTCHQALGPAHPQLTAVACALVVAHLRSLVELVQPGGTGILVTDTVTSETCALDELWGTRPPLVLLEQLETSGNHLSGTGPSFLRRILRTDAVIAPLVLAPRLVEPWLWPLNDLMTLLAYALVFRRA